MRRRCEGNNDALAHRVGCYGSWVSRVLALIVAFACAGCRTDPAATKPPVTPAATPDPDPVASETGCAPELKHLQALATCLEQAVVVLNREPEDGALAAYLHAANEADPSLGCPEPRGDVAWERSEGPLDHFEDGSAEASIEYAFSTPGCGPVVTTITLVMP